MTSTTEASEPWAGQVLWATDVSKRFKSVQALEGAHVRVAPGEVVALIGTNGAGKSTLIRVLATAVIPDSGVIRVGGVDPITHPSQARTGIGVVLGEERSFFLRLSGRANLDFFASLHGVRRRRASVMVREVLATVGLLEAADRRVDSYSTGMRARLGIARGLLGAPKALLLDEPTRSVDPVNTGRIQEVLHALAHNQRVAILVASHDLHETVAIADRIQVMTAGRVVETFSRGVDSARLEAALVAAAPPLN